MCSEIKWEESCQASQGFCVSHGITISSIAFYSPKFPLWLWSLNSRFCFCTLQPKYYVENLSHFIYGAYLSSFNKLIDSSVMSSSPNFIHFFLPNVHLNLDCFDPCSCYFDLLLLGRGDVHEHMHLGVCLCAQWCSTEVWTKPFLVR